MTILDENLQDYCEKQAQEYETVYYRDDPVRRREQEFIANKILVLLKNTRTNLVQLAFGSVG